VACPYPKQTLGRALLPVLQSSMDNLGLRDRRSFPALRGEPYFLSVQLLSSLAAAIGLIWALCTAILAEASWLFKPATSCWLQCSIVELYGVAFPGIPFQQSCGAPRVEADVRAARGLRFVCTAVSLTDLRWGFQGVGLERIRCIVAR
jgi:hypothetical protein